MNIKVNLIIKNRIYREGVEDYFSGNQEFVVGDAFSSVTQAGPRLAVHAADVVVVDTQVAELLGLVRAIKYTDQKVKIVMIILNHEEHLLRECVAAGVEGFVTCNDGMRDLCACIKTVYSGRVSYPSEIANMIAANMVRASYLTAKTAKPFDRLTDRQTMVIELLERGLPNKAIARELGIELATVKNHVHQILEKLCVGNRGEAVAKFRKIQSHSAVVPLLRGQRR